MVKYGSRKREYILITLKKKDKEAVPQGGHSEEIWWSGSAHEIYRLGQSL